ACLRGRTCRSCGPRSSEKSCAGPCAHRRNLLAQCGRCSGAGEHVARGDRTRAAPEHASRSPAGASRPSPRLPRKRCAIEPTNPVRRYFGHPIIRETTSGTLGCSWETSKELGYQKTPAPAGHGYGVAFYAGPVSAPAGTTGAETPLVL